MARRPWYVLDLETLQIVGRIEGDERHNRLRVVALDESFEEVASDVNSELENDGWFFSSDIGYKIRGTTVDDMAALTAALKQYGLYAAGTKRFVKELASEIKSSRRGE